MAIRVMCPNGHALQVRDDYAGREGLCPHCRARVKVPMLRKVSDDDIAAMLSGPRAIGRVAPADESVHQEPSHNAAGLSGDSLLGSSLLRRHKTCPQCGSVTSATFANCPRCGTPLGAATMAAAAPQSPAPQQCAHSRHFQLEREADVLVVRFAKPESLDQATLTEILRDLGAVANRADCRHLLLNFGDHAGLPSLLLDRLPILKKRLEAKGGKLKICCVGHDLPEDPDSSMLGRALDVWPSEREALLAFEHRGHKHH
jgi:hypothetical protein